jgi:hypothetical protein
VHGTVTRDGSPLPGAYVRLLGSTGRLHREVQSSATGYFRFYAADGEWTLRTLFPGGSVDTAVTAVMGQAVVAPWRYRSSPLPPDPAVGGLAGRWVG